MKLILKKMHQVMLDVERIKKDAINQHQKYEYASEKAIKEAVGKAFREHGVVFTVEVDTPFTIGNILFVPIRYGFHDVDSAEVLTGTFFGAGHTRDDKGYYAAITGAIKYVITSNALIPTGDDPENAENSVPQRVTAKPESKQLNNPPRHRLPGPIKQRCLGGLEQLLTHEVITDTQRDDAVKQWLGVESLPDCNDDSKLKRLFDEFIMATYNAWKEKEKAA